MTHGDAEDGAAEIGVDGGFIGAGSVELETALCFGGGPVVC